MSVELDEIMSLSDRILVLFDGAIAGEVAGAAATEQTLGALMAGVGRAEVAANDPGAGLPRWAGAALLPLVNLLAAFAVSGIVILILGRARCRRW